MSFGHVVQKDGNLRALSIIGDMLTSKDDIVKTVEEMYGMIWFLAGKEVGREKQTVEDARKQYREGLKIAKKVNG